MNGVDGPKRSIGYLEPGGGSEVAMLLDTRVTSKVTASQTGGAYSLFELEVAPGGGERRHIQHREDECLYVLEGRFEFSIEGETLPVAEGTTLYIPKGTVHGFENLDESPGRLLAIHTPGGTHESFVEEAGARMTGQASPPAGSLPNLQSFAATAAKHGIELVPPP